MIANLINYDGDIFIGKYNLKNINCHSIIYIPQQPVLFNDTIYYNLNYDSNLSINEIYHKLRNYNMDGFVNKLQNKLLTKVNNNGTNLSGGQRYLIALLCGIIQNKSIILLDEPTASLDKYHRELLINLIKSLSNKTIIIVTHDNELITICDKVIRI